MSEGLRICVEVTEGGRIKDVLDAAAAVAKKPAKSAQAAAEWIAGETFRIFSAGYNADGVWEPLSKITLFIRKHRANTPRDSDQPGSDTGRLKDSFIPDFDQSGKLFGAGTNVDYAEDFNNGGPSKANVVAIAGFKRANSKKRLKDYLMHLQAGHDVPPRRFFPGDMAQLQSWGYVDKIREIFKIEFKDALGGSV